jgi:hypothetical protein
MTNKSQQSLPPGLTDDVERGVMDYVRRHPSPPRNLADPAKLLSAAAVMAILLLFAFGMEPSAPRYRNTDFVEQQLLLDHHTAIWLTPIEANHSAEAPR